MRFAHPEFLNLLILPILLFGLLIWNLNRRRRTLERFGSLDLVQRLVPPVPWEWNFLRTATLSLGVGMFILAIAQPQWGTRLETVHRRGVDVMVALDTSLSMLAEDTPPNRLVRAKAGVVSFLEDLQGDRVGLVAFAGTSYVHCPLTADYSAVRTFLEILDPDLLPVPGTAIGDAIRTSLDAFPEGQRKYQVILLLTDGEDSDSDPIGAAREAANQGVRIFTIGIGTPSGGLIPVKAGRGRVAGYKKDGTGQVVTTRLDESTLEQIARITGGNYYRSTTGEWEMERVAETVGIMEKKEFEDRSLRRLEHRYQIPLFLALLVLGVEFCLPAHWRPALNRSWFRAIGTLFLVGGMVLSVPAPAGATPAARRLHEGNRFYREGKYQEALQRYSEAQLNDPGAPEIPYNLGNTLYRQGRYAEAVEEYRRSHSAADRELAQASYYNTGNSLFRLHRYGEAIGAYEEALRLDPKDPNAKQNLEIALARLRQQEQDRARDRQSGENQPEPDSIPSPPGGGKDQEEQQRQDRSTSPLESPAFPENRMTREEALRVLSAVREDEKESLRRGIHPPIEDRQWEQDW